MTVMLLLILAAAATQTDALFTGAAPPEAPTFEVTLAGARQPFYAALRVEGQWVLDHRTEIKPEQVVEFVPDIPYDSGDITRTMMRNATLAYEAPAMRRKRLHDTWTSMGYTFMETPSGWRAVREEDIQLAQRAREMAQNATYQPSSLPKSLPLVVHPPSGSEENRFSPGMLWAARAGILTAAMAALALLYFFGRGNKDAWTRL